MRNILVLNWFPKGQAMRQAVHQHQHALDGGEDTVVYHNAVDPAPRWLRALPWDAVVLHTVFLCARWVDEFPLFRRRFAWIADLECVKIAIPQDEYDHSENLDDWLSDLGVTHVLSCFGPEYRELLYPKTRRIAEFREVLTGYIDRATAESCAPTILPLADRPYDIVYRALKLPYWFGSHGALKHEIAVVVEEQARSCGLATDISTRWEDTIFDGWFDFLGSGRTVIGVESGSSVLDRRGEIKAQITAIEAEHPGASFAEVDSRLPPGWDAYAFFAISPRHLEAVITKTCQILIEGRYSGALEPERHYIPLRRDFSNLPDVLDRLQDHAALARIAQTAYDEVYLPGAYDLERYADGIRALIPKRSSPSMPQHAVQVADDVAGKAREAASRAAVGLAVMTRRSARRIRASSLNRVALGAAPTTPVTFVQAATRRARISQMLVAAALARDERRRLLLRYVADGAWREIPPRALARDVLRIAVLDRLERTGARKGATSVDATETTLVVKTHSGTTGFSGEDGVYWDHAGADSVVPIDATDPQLGSLAVGENGVYKFDALSALHDRYRELVRGAIVPVRDTDG